MSELNAVLFANAAFYAAFTSRDPAAMEKVWAKDKTVSCTHPGWQPLTGRDEVMSSWRSIMANPESPNATCRQERVVIYGDCAVLTCIERITDSHGNSEYLTASNIFMRAGQIWVMVHHQSGPVNIDPRTLEDTEERPTLN